MEEADRLCERVAIMDHGRILALDTPGALKASTGADTVVTVKTTGASDQLGQVLERELEGITMVRPSGDSVQLHVKGKEGILPQIVISAERAGFDILDVSISEPTLETVFITLTGRELRD
jgi:ABC-2 type transport system ATP-binding protein